VSPKRITIGFSSHHIEVLPFMRWQMERHHTIILEEPPSALFPEMLAGLIPAEDYLMEADSQFPQFDCQMCGLIREMHREGKQILQVEPYLETLIRIHELLTARGTKDEVKAIPGLTKVYEAESMASGALINFYSTSMGAAFIDVVAAVKIFAKADAKRLSLREDLRARAIASMAGSSDSIFVEAGYIHYPLYLYLRRELGSHRMVKVVYPMQGAVRGLGGKRRNMGPGDILTLHYALGHNPPDSLSDLLAARSLIYIKIIEKDELLPGSSPTPHCEDEVRINRIVDNLSLDDCAILFDRIRRMSNREARASVGLQLDS